MTMKLFILSTVLVLLTTCGPQIGIKAGKVVSKQYSTSRDTPSSNPEAGLDQWRLVIEDCDQEGCQRGTVEVNEWDFERYQIGDVYPARP